MLCAILIATGAIGTTAALVTRSEQDDDWPVDAHVQRCERQQIDNTCRSDREEGDLNSNSTSLARNLIGDSRCATRAPSRATGGRFTP
jgi:hypothetical protein